MKELTSFIVKRLVDKPETAHVDETMEGDVAVLKVVVAEEDKGKVIGKQGKVVKAIRAVVAVAAQKAGRRVVVEVD
jgi:predicted RNA-binding protein YlqC (UPF0109 family)